MPFQQRAIAVEDTAGPLNRESGERFEIGATGGLYVDEAPPGAFIRFDDSRTLFKLKTGRTIVQRFSHFTVYHPATLKGELQLFTFEKGEDIYDSPPPGERAVGAGNLIDYALSYHGGGSAIGGASMFTEGFSRGGGNMLAGQQQILGAAAFANATQQQYIALHRGRAVGRYESLAAAGVNPAVNSAHGGHIGFPVPLERGKLARAADQLVYRLIAEVAFSGLANVPDGKQAGIGMHIGWASNNEPVINSGVGFGVGVLESAVKFFVRKVNGGAMSEKTALAWPVASVQDFVRVEFRISPATPDADAKLTLLLNDAAVLERRWGGATPQLPSYADYAGGWSFFPDLGNFSDGLVSNFYLADFRQVIGPVE